MASEVGVPLSTSETIGGKGTAPLVPSWLEDSLVTKVFCSVHLSFSWDLGEAGFAWSIVLSDLLIVLGCSLLSCSLWDIREALGNLGTSCPPFLQGRGPKAVIPPHSTLPGSCVLVGCATFGVFSHKREDLQDGAPPSWWDPEGHT